MVTSEGLPSDRATSTSVVGVSGAASVVTGSMGREALCLALVSSVAAVYSFPLVLFSSGETKYRQQELSLARD